MQNAVKTKKTGWHRPQLNELPPVKLPFYPRSVGHFMVDYHTEENIPAGQKPFVQLFWLISGEMEFIFDGVPFLLKGGEVCYRLPGEPHIQKVISHRAEYRWLAFDGGMSREFIESYGFPRTGWYAGECPVELFTEYEERMREMTPGCWLRMCSIITEVLSRAGNSGTGRDSILTTFRRAVAVCRNNFTSRDFDVNALSASIGINRSTINRHFIRHMGISAGQYISQLKLQYAVSLLQSTLLGLAEIAALSGFYDAPYLCRIIKKHYGISPDKLRK